MQYMRCRLAIILGVVLQGEFLAWVQRLDHWPQPAALHMQVWQPTADAMQRMPCGTSPSLLLYACRESFLPGSKAREHNSQQEAAYGPDSIGKYDPILHKWILEPDQEKWAARERAHANQVSPLLHLSQVM